MPTTLDQEEEDRLAQFGPDQGYPYDTTENGPQVPPEALGAPLDNIDYGGAAPLPLGTANNNYAARFGIQNYQPPGEINYSENDKSLIRRNEDERLVALGVNPAAYRKAQVEAEVQANRMQGLLGYQNDRASGLPHEQALLKNFTKLYANNPHQGVVDVSKAAAGVPAEWTVKSFSNEAGQPAFNALMDENGKIHSAQAVANPNSIKSAPLDAQANIEIAKGDLTESAKALAAARNAESAAIGKAAKEEARNATKLAEGAYERAKDARREVSTNWMGRTTGPQVPAEAVPKAAAPESSNTVIKYDKTGKGWVVDEKTKKVLRPAN